MNNFKLKLFSLFFTLTALVLALPISKVNAEVLETNQNIPFNNADGWDYNYGWELSSDDSYASGSSFKFTGTGGGVLQSPVDASGSNYIAISPDTDYLLTFWYKSTTSNILLTVGGCCAEGTYGTQQLIGTGDWVKIELIFTTDEDPGIFVQLYQNITDETLAYVDEMFLEVYVPEEPPTENETLESIDNKLTDILTNTDNIDDNINILVHVVYLFIIVLLASAVWKFYTYIFTVFI